MGREEYLRKLMEEIKDFPDEDRQQIREYFEEMICDRIEDGETEEEILQAIGSPQQAGMKLRSEYESRPENGFSEDEDTQDAEDAENAQDEGPQPGWASYGMDKGKQFSEKIMQVSESAMQMLEKIIQVPEKILSDMEERRSQQDMNGRGSQRDAGGKYGQKVPNPADGWQDVEFKEVKTEEVQEEQKAADSEKMQENAGEGEEQQEAEAKDTQENAGAADVQQAAEAMDTQENADTGNMQQEAGDGDAQKNANFGGTRQNAGFQDAQKEGPSGQNSCGGDTGINRDAGYSGLQFIRVEAENTKIHVRTVKRDTVQVLFQPREGMDEVWTSEEGGGFTFNHRMRKFWFFDVWEFGRNKWITVEIPENFHGRVELVTKNAMIQVENVSGLESLQAETSNAKINAARVAAERVWLQTSNASITVSEASGQDLWAKSSNSHISVDDAKFTGIFDVKTSNAAVEAAGVSAGSISLHTSNGAVRGWLSGSIADYDIESRTSNASSTLPTNMHMGKGKKLKVRTSNGKIDIRFAENS